MSILLQQIAIIVVVALAVAYLVYYFIRRRRQKTPCANCALMRTPKRDSKSSVRPPVVRN